MHKDGQGGKLSVRDIVKNALETAGFKPPCEIPAASFRRRECQLHRNENLFYGGV